MHGTAQQQISHDSDAWCGWQDADRWEARILIQCLEVPFGSIDVLVTIEGDEHDWTLWAIETPDDPSVVDRYAKTGVWSRYDWERVDHDGLNQHAVERRITAAVMAWLNVGTRAADALREVAGI